MEKNNITEKNSEEKDMIAKFNTTLQEFLNDISSAVPKYSEHIKNTFDFSKINVNTEKKYLNIFMENSENHIKKISECDESCFLNKEEKVYLLEGIDFTELWGEIQNEENKKTVWKYLHTLYIIGNALKSDIGNLSQLLQQNKNEDMKELSEHANIMLNMFNSLNQKNNDMPNIESLNNDIDNTSIGKIAQELASEINLADFGLDMNNSDNSNPADLFSNLFNGKNNKLMDLITNVGNKIQSKLESGDINEDILMKEAQDMMKNNPLFGNNPLFSNPDLMKQMQQGNLQIDQNKVKKERLRDKLKKKLKFKKKK